MYLGKIVEMGDTEALFANPAHPYTTGAAVGDSGDRPRRAAQRIELDPALVNREAPLVEVEPGHLAAVLGSSG